MCHPAITKDQNGIMLEDSVPDATDNTENVLAHFASAADREEDKAAASSGSFKFLACEFLYMWLFLETHSAH